LADESRPPNIVFLLADDLGWNGLGCYGSDLHPTPHLNRLARRGIRFTDAYSACTVCSPTRAAVLTGKYPARLHLTDWIPGQNRPQARLKIPDWTMHLEHREVTVAEALGRGGYATAHIGKWHLGGDEYFPETQGFDVNIGGTAAGSPRGGYFLPNGIDLLDAKKGDYLTDRLTDEALRLMTDWKSKSFFIYLAYYTVHTPIQGKPELVDVYRSQLERAPNPPSSVHTNPTYAAMVHSLDNSVGRIVAKLKELGLADNTVVIFTSDNGGLSHRMGKPTAITRNDPLRRGKGSAYEGGVRVPLIVAGQGVNQGRECGQPVTSVDFYRTILELTGTPGEAAHNRHVDGLSLVPLLGNATAKLDRDAIFWHYPHYHAGGGSPYGAVRDGDWKLIEFYEDRHVELYNLADDIGEQCNLVAYRPDLADTLRDRLQAWRADVGAQMPTSNPDFNAKQAVPRSRKRK
jgi:arylsulfatase A-like enzyme